MTKSLAHLADRQLDDPDFGKWFFFAAKRQQLDEARLHKPVGQADAKPSPKSACRGTYVTACCVHEGEHAASLVPEHFTCPSKPYTPFGTIKQTNPQIDLQFLDCSRQGGGLNMNSGCGACKALFFRDDQEISQMA